MPQNTFIMMGTQFEKVDGTPLALSEIGWNFDLASVPMYDSGKAYQATAPQIQVMQPDSPLSTTYYYAGRVRSGVTQYYWFSPANTLSDSVKINPGAGFWYRDPSAEPNFTTSGQVMPDSPFTKTYEPGVFCMLVCPYPKSYTLADLVIDGADAYAPTYDSAKAYQTTAMQIQVPNADSPITTAYYYAGRLVGGQMQYYWFSPANQVVRDPTTVKIPLGRGCWFRPAKTAGAGSVTVSISL